MVAGVRGVTESLPTLGVPDTKTETAVLLRSLGFSFLEIAAELYPEDYRRYRETRDPRLREVLRDRVKALLKYYRKNRKSHFPPSKSNPSPPLWASPLDGDNLDDTGGVREPLAHASPPTLGTPRERKRGKKGIDRQIIEYEQLLYYYYKKYVRRHDVDGVIWNTARLLHYTVFPTFYEMYKKNIWGLKNGARSTVARSYAYAVLFLSGLVYGLYHLRHLLYRELGPDRRELEGILPLLVKHIL